MPTCRIAELRNLKGWSQLQLAIMVREIDPRFSKIGQEHISRIERRVISPSIDLGLAVARALDVSAEELFGTGEDVDTTKPEGAA